MDGLKALYQNYRWRYVIVDDYGGFQVQNGVETIGAQIALMTNSIRTGPASTGSAPIAGSVSGRMKCRIKPLKAP